MVSTRKKRQSNKRLLSQLDDFDQDMIIGNAASDGQENNVVSEGTSDRDFATGTRNNNVAINESTANMKTLERCFNERIDSCLLYTSPSPRDGLLSRMPSSA